MNKQIEKLALECGAWHQVYEPKRFLHNHNFDIERFAELIVRECARLCEHESNDDEYDQYDMGQSVKAESIKTAIKEHFGVEE